MARRCEVCESLSPGAPPVRRLQRFLVEGVTLLFREEAGNRSLVSRRAPLDRRQFPMRPEGRRRTSGRRATDAG
jgi:hypothetical protein